MLDESANPAAASEPTPSGWHRLRGSRSFWALLVPLVTAAAGAMFAMSFQAAQGSDLRADRDLPQLIVAGDERVAARATQLDSLQQQVKALTAANSPGDRRLAELTSAAAALSNAAAETKVTGQGLEVSLTDSDRSLDSLPDGFTADDVVVHQQDVQGVVNALWASGAEAMMIQDQRIISTSAVRCVGNTLILQGRVYAPPYVIKAIGDPDRMQQMLDTDPSVTIYRQYVEAAGLGYEVTAQPTLELPGYTGSVDFRHATPIG